MSEYFVTDIEITQFKCFSDFTVSGFKRVNLIGGKNNMGKTALMEACFINLHSIDVDTMITVIHSVKFARENLNFISQGIDDLKLLNATPQYSAKTNLSHKAFYITENNAKKEYQFVINDWSKTIAEKDLSLSFVFFENILFIDKFGWSDGDLAKAFHTAQRLGYEFQLNRSLKEFDRSLEGIQITGDQVQCKTHGVFLDINDFGGGLKHYLSILCALCVCKNGYLFIDEIDNVLHHSQLDNLWELILKLSKATHCQVFATTHSEAMPNYLARMARKLDDQAISYTLLDRNPQHELVVETLGFQQLTRNLD
ncbi:MAG: AAA family ATPase [Methylococcaceae bacterium]|nr:AAA family ATPase [Methylococcaceae bacterium]